MGHFFNYDGPLFTAINKFVDCLFLSVLWVAFSIPIVTIGASCTAAYYTANKVLRHSRGYVFIEFWGCFKSSFKQSTIIWLIFAAIGLILYTDIRLIGIIVGEGTLMETIAKAFFYAMFFLLIMLAMYVFPYIARFEIGLKNVVKNCMYMATRHILWTLLLVVITAVSGFFIYLIPPLAIFIVPGIDALLATLVIERIFKKYMSAEDIAKEEKLNGTNRDYIS